MSRFLSHEPVTRLKGVGDSLARRFAEVGVKTLLDLVIFLPSRYQNKTIVKPIANLAEDEEALIQGCVTQVQKIPSKAGKSRVQFFLQDETGRIGVTLFHFHPSQVARLSDPHLTWQCFGKVSRFGASLNMVHPEFERVPDDAADDKEPQYLTAVYNLPKGISQKRWRGFVKEALAWLATGAELDSFPEEVRRRYQLPTFLEALAYVHQPPLDADVLGIIAGSEAHRQRISLEEILAYQIFLQHKRIQVKKQTAKALPKKDGLLQDFINSLPFQLTGAQQRVNQEVSVDLALTTPMSRLVQGDVGSGKTVVAACAMLQAVANKHQAVLMAPTEILAEQHYINFCRWFKPLSINVALLTSQQKQDSEEADVIIGTHALFQASVKFSKLALVVIDEQHRFGVNQRLALYNKAGDENGMAHQLVMTATPIPRTLAMLEFGDMDLSILDELPPGRQSIQTALLNNDKRAQVIERIKTHCGAGKQAYWVCPAIDENEQMPLMAAEQLLQNLQQALPDIKIGLLHGRMKTAEKQQIMQAFKEKALQLLVATTVIEVGVDVPNASLMIIENAERFGLAQLHQLRGRVGRGDVQSYCVLLYHSPLSHHARQRLQAMRDSNDGFYLAEQDLAIRGPGEVLGAMQAGWRRWRVAESRRDAGLLNMARQLARELTEHNFSHSQMVKARWYGQNEALILA